MNERQWELYRLSVVEKWAESPYKRAVSDAIEHKLMVLGQDPAMAAAWLGSWERRGVVGRELGPREVRERW